jgi:di/tricarboxylate transporter
MLPLATALDRTGAARLLADAIGSTVGALGPLALLVGFFLLAVVLTQLTSGIATALLVGPIALNAALAAGLNPQAFMMAVALACSTAFLSPVGHPANLLVMGPGGYRFHDYTRVGVPLFGLTLLLVLLLLPRVWPLGG